MDTSRCNEVASKAGALRCASRSRALLALLAVLLVPATARPASDPVRTDHLDSRLVAQAAAAVPGQTLTLGLLLEHDPHWHTYWRNPGDSGLPTRIELDLPDGKSQSPARIRLLDVFDVNVCGRDVKLGKPAPDLFLLAAEELQVPAEDCIVVEDATAGVQAAKAGGMRAIGLARLDDAVLLQEAGADLVVTVLDDVAVEPLVAGTLRREQVAK